MYSNRFDNFFSATDNHKAEKVSAQIDVVSNQRVFFQAEYKKTTSGIE